MTSPIGALSVEAEQKAAKKATRSHTAQGPCGCQVTVAWFTATSRSYKFEPCHDHHDPASRGGAK